MTDLLDCQRLKAEARLPVVEYHASLGSTNDRGRELAVGTGPWPALVVAEEQTAGRGRGANRWWTGQGSLAWSLVVDFEMLGIAPRHAPRLSLAAGCAVVQALGDVLPALEVGLHWPNDVFISSRKICGILVESPPGSRYVIGVGVNVNNSLHLAPQEVQSRAISLVDLAGYVHDRTSLLLELLDRLTQQLSLLRDAPDEVCRLADRLCLQHGQWLVVDTGGEHVGGYCRGIADDGSLQLETPRGLRAIHAGALVH